MTRDELLECLEVERYAPLPPRPANATNQGPSLALRNELEPVSPEQAARNRRVLLEAISGPRHPEAS